MVRDHPVFEPPEDINQKIWRYTDFTKFVDLLNSQSLFFNRSDKFDDVFEGSIPKTTAAIRDKQMLEQISSKRLHPRYSPDFWQNYGQKIKSEYGISCWHMNNHESAAMWKLYLKSNEGIAIQTTYKKLRETLNSSDISIFIGTVKYIDYETDIMDITNGFTQYLHKRQSFHHEQELRAILTSHDADNTNKVDLSNGGQKVKIEIEDLIENIYVSPESPKWLTDLVKDTVKQFGHTFNVINSRLNDNPVF